MKRKTIRALFLLVVLLFTFSLYGCTSDTQSASSVPSDAGVSSAADTNTVSGIVADSIGDVIQNSAQELATYAAGNSEAWTDADNTTSIEMNGTNHTITGEGASASNGTLTISKAGSYILSGTLTDGQIIIAASKDDTVCLILNGASITCSSSAPIYCRQSGELILTIVEGTSNSVTDGQSYNFASGEDEPDAAIFSKNDLTINGGGTLTVTGNYNNGICSKDNLVIANGNISVTAVNDALKGRDCVIISGGTFTLSAGGDGIQSNNDEDTEKGFVFISGGTFLISAGGDGIQAQTALMISDGTFTIETSAAGTADSFKGLKAAGSLLITSGHFTIDSADDAIHSNVALGISGGTFIITSEDDGMHADGALVIDGGTITIIKSYEGIEGASVTVNGGTLDITASDDGFNAAGGNDASGFGRPGENSFNTSSEYFIKFTGGTVNVNASGDGIDSNGPLIFEGGEIYVSGPTNSGNGTLDSQGELRISGGILVAAGSTGMAQVPGATSTQNSISFTLSEVQQGGNSIELLDSSGNTIVYFTPVKDYQSVVISSPNIMQGEAYSLNIGGAEYTTVTTSGVTTTSGSAAAGQMQLGGQPDGQMKPGNGSDKPQFKG